MAMTPQGDRRRRTLTLASALATVALAIPAGASAFQSPSSKGQLRGEIQKHSKVLLPLASSSTSPSDGPIHGREPPSAGVNDVGSHMSDDALRRLEGRLTKNMRETCQKFDMVEEGDHLMVCVSGGKDSATMLRLLMNLRERLARPGGTDFRLTAVHLDQRQPGYDGTSLVSWLDSLSVPYRILSEDTFSIVKDKTPESKTYCSLCSRLRRGILYTVARELGCNKLALGHHGDDAIETLLLNAIHAGQLKSMPARYYSADRDIHVIRPLIGCAEADIREYAMAMDFPILPCNLCGSQPDAQRAKVKMLVGTLDALSPDARRNFVRALGDVRPSHLLDVGLREACGLDKATGVAVEMERARLVHGIMANGEGSGIETQTESDANSAEQVLPLSFIESLL